jgi:hypothetical protein
VGTFSKGTIERLKLHVFEGKSSADVFSEMFKELTSDLERARADASSPDDQYHRRAYLRSFFSYSEAILFRLKQYLLDQSAVLKISITDNEKLVLDEHKVEMQADGTLQRKDLMPNHKTNVMFTLKFISRKLDLDRQSDFGNNGWREYCTALEKRHALTHPKFPSDLTISDEELLNLRNADAWLQGEFTALFNNFASKLREAQSGAASVNE